MPDILSVVMWVSTAYVMVHRSVLLICTILLSVIVFIYTRLLLQPSIGSISTVKEHHKKIRCRFVVLVTVSTPECVLSLIISQGCQ